MTESKSPSFYISFETLFLHEDVAVKDTASVKAMTEVHRLLMDNGTITDAQLLDYCTSLWSFVAFVRAHRQIQGTVKLDWRVRNQSCNCYWWAVLCRCNQFATAVLQREFKLEAKKEELAQNFLSIKAALGLLYKVRTECCPQWTDRGTSQTFEKEIDDEIKECNECHRQLRMRALAIGAQILEARGDDQEKAAQMYAAIYRLSGFTDERALKRGLLARSLHRHGIAQYGMAIALAQAYEKLTKDVPHPFLAEWQKHNDTVFHHAVPAALDPKEALMAAGESIAYEQGTLPTPRILFVSKTST